MRPFLAPSNVIRVCHFSCVNAADSPVFDSVDVALFCGVFCSFFPPTTIMMPPCATLCNIPLSTTFNPDVETSLVSIDWVLTSGVSTANSVVSGCLRLPYHDCVDSRCFCGLTFLISFFAVTGLVSVVLRHQTLALISRRVSLTYGLHLFKVSSFTLSYHGPFEVVQLLPLLHGTLLVPWALMATKIFTPLAVSPSISHLHLQIVGQARRLPRRKLRSLLRLPQPL